MPTFASLTAGKITFSFLWNRSLNCRFNRTTKFIEKRNKKTKKQKKGESVIVRLSGIVWLADPQTGWISSQCPEVETGLSLVSPSRVRILLLIFAVIPRVSTSFSDMLGYTGDWEKTNEGNCQFTRRVSYFEFRNVMIGLPDCRQSALTWLFFTQCKTKIKNPFKRQKILYD